MKRNKGITLVALVVTIIVLLILAGLSISLIMQNNGIVSRAKNSKEMAEISQEKEAVQFAAQTCIVANTDTLKIESNDQLQSELNNYLGEGKATSYSNGDGSYTIEFTSGRTYTLESNNDITIGNYNKDEGTSIVEEKITTSKEIHIYTVGDLKWLANQVNTQNKNFEGYKIYLENNLDLGARPDSKGNWESTDNDSKKWTPIGNMTTMLKAEFKGNSHKIKGIYINDSTLSNLGLFGVVANNVENLSIKNSYICGNLCVGAIAGNAYCAENNTIQILNCSNEGTEVTGNAIVGGLIGTSNFTELSTLMSGGVKNTINFKNCTNSGKVLAKGNVYEYTQDSNQCYEGMAYCGGMIGFTYNTSICDCINLGEINGMYNYISGIVGYIYNNGNINNCKNSGTINQAYSYAVGGIIGHIIGETKITNCSNSGNINALPGIYGSYIGGIAGDVDNITLLSNCSNSGDIINANKNIGGIIGATQASSDLCTIEKCYNRGNIIGKDIVISGQSTRNSYGIAGIVGTYFKNTAYTNAKVKISKCYNTGNISGNSSIAGIVAYNHTYDNSMIVEDCFNLGNISATQWQAGGIMGYIDHISTLKNCYIAGKIYSNSGYSGAIAGQSNTTFVLDNCYAEQKCSNATSNNGIVQRIVDGKAITGTLTYKTQEEMKSESLATGLGTENWKYDANQNSGYPSLKW